MLRNNLRGRSSGLSSLRLGGKPSWGFRKIGSSLPKFKKKW